MEEMMKILKSIEEDMQKTRKDMNKMKDTIIQDINENINTKFENIDTKFSVLETKVEEQQTAIDRMEQYLKKKNLVFFGVEENEKSYRQLEEIVLKIITEKLKIPSEKRDIESVKRIGKQTENTRPIVVTLCTMGLKFQILKNRKYLEESTIYIKEDFTQKILQKRKELQNELKVRKEQGENVALRYDKIITLKNNNKNTAKPFLVVPNQLNSSPRNHKRKPNSSPESLSKTQRTNIFNNAKKTKTKIDTYIKTRTTSLPYASSEMNARTNNADNDTQL